MTNEAVVTRFPELFFDLTVWSTYGPGELNQIAAPGIRQSS